MKSLALAALFLTVACSRAAITDGLVGHWAFDETNGAVATDTTTNANHGTLHNFPADSSQWAAGRIGNALQFRGPASGDYVRVTTYPKPATNLTVAAWVWADARPIWASIAKNWGGGAAGQFHFGLTASDGDLSCYLATAAGAVPNKRESVPLPMGSWQHVAFTADGSTLKLYRNGAQVGSSAHSGGLVAPPHDRAGHRREVG
jgi:tRNA U34 5-methylaminomethyl-2-thiouridine-forming methyltransferase MnmC